MKKDFIEIQPILWPRAGICTEESLYFRRDAAKTAYIPGQDALVFQENGTASFDTYFNGFSYAKWKKYTALPALALRLQTRGEFQVTLFGCQYRNGAVVSRVLTTLRLPPEAGESILEFRPDQDYLLCGFTLQALSDDVMFTGGSYGCLWEEEILPPVTIALNICTYHRERFVRTTIHRLRREVWEKENSPLAGHLLGYVTDNGQTLTPQDLGGAPVRLLRQDSKGSAGGFARGQLEILADKEAYGTTHMVFMDDDISFDPQILLRTYWFLRFLREEYREYFLGGDLLRLHEPGSQVESGAQWAAGMVMRTKPDLDLRRLDHLLFHEIEEKVDYQGWWYCCVPLSKDMPFPLPVYFHRDDVDFGLRHKGFLFLNGIGVWHDEFENKPSSVTEYFDFRNRLIINALHCPGFGAKAAVLALVKETLKRLLRYRYREAKLILEGAEDYCKGAEWILSQDRVEQYERLVQKGYHPQPLAACVEGFDLRDYEGNLRHLPLLPKRKRLLRCLLGFLLPAKYTRSVPMFMPSIDCFYRAKRVINYNSAAEQAFVTEKSLSVTLSVTGELLSACIRLLRQYDPVAAEWRSRQKELTSLEVLEKHFDI